MATKRVLQSAHPIAQLLLPHFEGTIFINNKAVASLVAPGQQVDVVLGGTITSELQLVGELARAKFNSVMLPASLASRGVTSPALSYPYRDDSMRIWGAIEHYVTDFVHVWYKNDADVVNDAKLQAWAAELVKDGMLNPSDFGLPIGGGNDTRGVFTVAYLIQVLTMVIFTGSAQHAAVNFTQATDMIFVPSFPGAIYTSSSDLRTAPIPALLAPTATAKEQVSFLTLLGGVRYTTLGHRGYLSSWQMAWNELLHPSLLFILKQFSDRLHDIEADITAANATRYHAYDVLLPSKIPQSINI